MKLFLSDTYFIILLLTQTFLLPRPLPRRRSDSSVSPKPPGLKPPGLKPPGLKPPGLKPPGLKPPGLNPLGLKPPKLLKVVVVGQVWPAAIVVSLKKQILMHECNQSNLFSFTYTKGLRMDFGNCKLDYNELPIMQVK